MFNTLIIPNTPGTPPPPPDPDAGKMDFSLTTQSALIALLEDI